MPAGAVDRLSDGPQISRWPVVALVVALVLVAAGGWAEGRRRAPAERAALTACAARADAATSYAERRVAATSSYIAPAFVTAEPALRESMRGLLSRAADRVVEPVEAALARCRSVGLWPFNRSHDETRDAYVTYLVAERDRLHAVVRDGSAYDQGYAEVQRLADAARARLSE
jgi:hypothetical protein